MLQNIFILIYSLWIFKLNLSERFLLLSEGIETILSHFHRIKCSYFYSFVLNIKFFSNILLQSVIFIFYFFVLVGYGVIFLVLEIYKTRLKLLFCFEFALNYFSVWTNDIFYLLLQFQCFIEVHSLFLLNSLILIE